MSSCKKLLWLASLVCSAVVFISPAASVQAAEVRVGAGAAPTENIFSKIMAPMEKAIGVKLALISNGPVAALKDLDQGKVDAASGGLTFQDWMALMEKEGYSIPDKAAYKHRIIGKDLIRVITNKDVGITKLSRENLKGIFTGKITNWSQVGGPDLAITIVSGDKIPGTQSVFQKQMMDGEPYASNVVKSGTAQEVKEKVSSTPGAAGLAPLSLLDSSVLAPEIPEVGRPITLITKGAPSEPVLKMLDYISGEGQKYIK